MKKVFLLMLAAGLLASCEKTSFNDVLEDEGGAEYPVYGKVKKFTFTLKGDFSDEWKPVTRAYLNAEGKDLTDVWVLDYMDGNLVQQLHQSDNTAEDFGQPVMNLSYGTHHVYFIASRGTDAVLDTENHLIKFGKISDTFYKDYEVSVVSTTNGNRAVTLDRCVTRLRLTFTDAISADAATINVAPHTWYYGLDYIDGTPADAKTDQTVTITIPDSEKGKTDVRTNIFGFSTAAEWTTNVAINSKTSTNTIIGQASITSAPFKANRITDYSGPLFSSEGSMTLSLNDTWDNAYNGAW